MPDRRILFSDPMIRAILDGRKTQTRRVIRRMPKLFEIAPGQLCEVAPSQIGGETPARIRTGNVITTRTLPYGLGDRIWVREAWARVGDETDDIHACPDLRVHAYYRADAVDPERQRWRSPIFMPRWASRLTLTVTGLRIQRIQDVSEDDAVDEGAPVAEHQYTPGARMCETDKSWRTVTPRLWYRELWDSLNAKRGFGWDTNPWVCAVTFTAHRCNIDQMEAAYG